MKKLSLSLLIVLLLAIVALGWAFDRIFTTFLADEQNSPVAHYEMLGRQLAAGLNDSADPEQFLLAWQTDQGTQLSLLTADELPLPDSLWQPLQQGQPLILETAGGLILHDWLPTHQRILAMAPPALQTNRRQTVISALLSVAFYSGIALLLLLWLLPLVFSLRRLRQSALDWGRGDFSARLPSRRLSYITDIEHTFNRMADQIESLLQDNRLISSAVSHDLRTPLARLRFGIDMLSESTDPAERRRYEDHLSNDIDEMQALVEALLHYARLEQHLVHLDREPVNLLDILQAYVDHHPNGMVTLATSTEHLWTSGQTTYLRMLLHNVLNNALNYGAGQVCIEAERSRDTLIIHIHDDGPGLDPAQLSTLVRPFVRGESDSGHQGFGMGLAIADRIAHWHNGQLQVQRSTRLSGAEFLITLPASRPDKTD